MREMSEQEIASKLLGAVIGSFGGNLIWRYVYEWSWEEYIYFSIIIVFFVMIMEIGFDMSHKVEKFFKGEKK